MTVLLWLFLITVFFFTATAVALMAAGYQVDWQNKRFIRTALLHLNGLPKPARIFVNNEFAAERFPVRLTDLPPGEYEVRVEKEGYVPWHKRFTLEPGEARSESDIRLFLIQPEVSVVTDPELINGVKNNRRPSLLIDGREIRSGSRLVTRVSGELKTAVLSPRRSHIYFQVGREIRVIETDGTNELLLFSLETDAASQLMVLADGKEIVFLDNEVVKRLRVI